MLELLDGRIVNTFYNFIDSSSEASPPSSTEDQDVALLQLKKACDQTGSWSAAPDSSHSQEAEDWEQLAFGSIKSNVYWTYVKSVGYWLAFAVLFFLVLMQGAWGICLN